MKIITVTLNPCIDINYKTDKPFRAGELNRVPAPSVSYNGKGINVSRLLLKLGEESVALIIGDAAGEAEKALRSEGLNVMAVSAPASSGGLRRNTSILDADGKETQINEPGMVVSDSVIKEFIGIFKSELNCSDEKTVVLCGSIPPGVDIGIYRKLCTIAKNSGAYVILDCDGEALKSGLEATPDLIKPNMEEFEALTGKKLIGGGEELRIDAVRAALEFWRNESSAVLCTLGSEGSVFAGPEGSYMCEARRAEIKTFKGAGDSYLAAFIYEHIVCGKDCDMAMMLASSAASRYLSE